MDETYYSDRRQAFEGVNYVLMKAPMCLLPSMYWALSVHQT